MILNFSDAACKLMDTQTHLQERCWCYARNGLEFFKRSLFLLNGVIVRLSGACTGWQAGRQPAGLLIQAVGRIIICNAQGGEGRISLDVPVVNVHQMVDGRGRQHPHAEAGVSHIYRFEG